MTISTNGSVRLPPAVRPYADAPDFLHRPQSGDSRLSFELGGVRVGGPTPLIIAGPCAVESEASFRRIARRCRAAGAHVVRGGAFKPRTSPYAFQGLGCQGLEILAACRDELGLPVCTEVLDPRDVELVARHVDVLQVGARNMQNYALLREVGRADRPVLLKRSPAATIEEWLFAAEYVLAAGNRRVILCERGIRSFESATRYTLDVAAVPVVLRESRLPVIVDPSHAAGKRPLVAALGLAGIAAGAHGLIVEVHDEPESAQCDGPQALLPEDLAALCATVRRVARATQVDPT